MQAKLILPFFIIISSLICCKSKKQILDTSDISDEQVVMMMKRGGCFGQCPIYEISIQSDHKAILKGERFFDKLGVYEKMLDQSTYDAFQKSFTDIGFENLPNQYESRIPDLAMKTLGYNVADTLKITKFKEGAPAELDSLFNQFHRLAISDGWTTIESAQEEELVEEKKIEYIKSEIIVKPSPGTNLPRWFQSKREEYGIRIKSRVSPAENLWLITYDKNKIEADALLEILIQDEAIESAEFKVKE